MADREGQQVDTMPVQLYGWKDGSPVRISVNEDGSPLEGMGIPLHDARVLVWTAGVLTSIEYYVGGVSGTLVATKTLNYSGGNLVSVVVT